MNKVILIGRLTKDPELKETKDGTLQFCKFILAVNNGHVKENGEKDVDFIPVVVWGKQAVYFSTYMKKGSLLSITGRLKIRSYEDSENNKKYSTDVIAYEIQFLANKSKKEIS